jgi:hypothetical protein
MFGIRFASNPAKSFSCARSLPDMPGRLAFRGAFKASADDGTAYVIDVFEVMDGCVDGAESGSVLYRTADGEAMKRLGTGIYEIEQSGLVVRSPSQHCVDSGAQTAHSGDSPAGQAPPLSNRQIGGVQLSD